MYELDDAAADPKKLELEQAQRERRQALEATKGEYEPLHFKSIADPRVDPKAKHAPLLWDYKGKYWAQKAAGGIENAPKLW